ncbi:uncharacterized protein LOC106011047 [Aplysia californica]|uniref:Uncharacterized protein LOC106011047 n=1 Tax=Aplysia californica TaxID=6500 RepID=A0ABM1VNX5_APLCA|nr:uncharacterized protein LOC106011047 [Aplysia californica]
MTGRDNPHLPYTPREGTVTPRARRKRARALVRSHSQHDVRGEQGSPSPPRSGRAELSVDYRAPGLLKIFGESLVAGARYKSVLASTRSSAQELIKQALERYGLPSRLHRDFVLCESVGKCTTATTTSADEDGRRGEGKEADLSGSIKSRARATAGTENNKKRGGHHHHRSSSPPSLSLSAVTSSSTLVSKRKHSGEVSARSLGSVTPREVKGRKKDNRSPLGSPRNLGDSPRTPLGSPRTPCGSPSTVRGSPLVSAKQGTPRSNGHQPVPQKHYASGEVLDYNPPKVFDTSRSTAQLRDIYRPRGERSTRLVPSTPGAGISPRPINNLNNDLDKRNNKFDSRNVSNSGSTVTDDSAGDDAGWVQVYLRVLSYSDRPLELQDYWKPPEGLSRRFELRRRCDVVMNVSDDDTIGLNDNARKIMMSKVSPGVIPPNSSVTEETDSQWRGTLKEEWDKASMMTNATLSITSPREPLLTNIVEGDTRQAYVCPSIYPYLLTLRGCSIQKDLVLYPLKSRSLCVGRAEKKGNSDDIRLCADDVSDVHCRVTLKRLPQVGETSAQDARLYWYCLDLEIYRSSYVTVNGIQVKQRATVLPGDLLGIGRQYLFLYKDPTGGHDIPSAVPWLPERDGPTPSHPLHNPENNSPSPLTHSHHVAEEALTSNIPENLRNREDDITNSQDDDEFDVLDDSTLRDAAIFLAYHRDKEVELLEGIADVKASGKGDYPLSVSVLFLSAHHYAVRKFSGDHQTTFFRRMIRVIRAKVTSFFLPSFLYTFPYCLSNQSIILYTYLSIDFFKNCSYFSLLSPDFQKKKAIVNMRQFFYLIHFLFSAITSFPGDKPGRSETDHFPDHIAWLSNSVTLLCHFRKPQFQEYVGSLARRADVTAAVQEAAGCLDEVVNSLFQQTVYAVTKVLYEPINSFMQGAISDQGSNVATQRIVSILQATRELTSRLQLHSAVARQLMTYVLFFISTTLFNRIMARGNYLFSFIMSTCFKLLIFQVLSGFTRLLCFVVFVTKSALPLFLEGAQLYSWEAGSRLQTDVSSLETWAKEAGLEAEFVRVSEHFLSLIDLLASSKRTLLKVGSFNYPNPTPFYRTTVPTSNKINTINKL